MTFISRHFRRLCALSVITTSMLAGNVVAGSHTGYVAPSNCATEKSAYDAAPWWNLIEQSVRWSAYQNCLNTQEDHRYDTKYPIVLVHGVSGFDQILGVVEYFHDIPATLRDGGAVVYTPNVTAWDDAEVRGEQLLTYIQTHVLPHSGATKVNLIGHSLGGPTARYVAGVRPDLVASVTTVNGVNFGSGFADWGMENFPEGSVGNDAIATLLNLLGAVTDFLAGDVYDQHALSAVLNMTSEGMADFNRRFPGGQPVTACTAQGTTESSSTPVNANGIRYFSWGSVGAVNDALDPLDYAMTFLGAISFPNGDNDGLVGRCAQRWGQVLRDNYNLNHTDATNLLFGMTGWTDPRGIYSEHASRLRTLNY